MYNDLPYDILVNKTNRLDSSYVPENLVTTDNNENNFHKYSDPSLKPMVRADIMPYIQAMFEEAKKSGLYLIVDSGYRSYQYQQVVLDNLVKEKGADAYKRAALPGLSEHQTGLAIDIACFRNGEYFDEINEFDEEGRWMAANSYKYGFILRYPMGKEDITGFDFEPWHFRFVGIELATQLFLENQTLEEYYSLKKK